MHTGMMKELAAALVVVVYTGVVGAVAIIVLVVEIYWAEVVAQSVRWLWQWGTRPYWHLATSAALEDDGDGDFLAA